jgi:hypothetical protein
MAIPFCLIDVQDYSTQKSVCQGIFQDNSGFNAIARQKGPNSQAFPPVG